MLEVPIGVEKIDEAEPKVEKGEVTEEKSVEDKTKRNNTKRLCK